AVVIACNTSTAHALDVLREESPVPVIGVIEPGARAAVASGGEGPVGVIGTAGTIASDAYGRAIRRLAPEAVVVQRPCPLFVPLVEEGWFDHPAAELVAREYLAPLGAAGVRSLVLGCTHYPLLTGLLERVMGPEVTLVDSGRETAGAVEQVLREKGMMRKSTGEPQHRFAVSDDPDRFRTVGVRFVGERLGAAEVVSVEGG
ncbi:MAG: glutamate racemase, partial [Gemmatimonadota bacterium]|nr:glutamate racemase [Gemmatimonadota bacterium]